jgi:hypothetical protein
MKVTVGRLGYVAAVSAVRMGSRGHDIWQLTLPRAKPTRLAFSGWQNAAAVDVVPARNLLTSVLSVVSLALADARERGQVVVPSVVSGARAFIGSGLGISVR